MGDFAQHRPAGGQALRPLIEKKRAKDLLSRASGRLEAAREQLRREAARSGLDAVRRYTAAVDEVIISLWSEAAEAAQEAGQSLERIALAALGGYGRAELNLYSDIDILAIVPGDMVEDEKRAVLQLFHLLWDMHLDLGHAAKTAAECLETLGADVDSATALIESRFLAGKREVFDSMRRRFEERLRSDQRYWYLEFRRRDWEGRHARYGSSIYLLEPNVKQSEGGLRDIHTLCWLAFLFYGTASLEPLESDGLISAAEHRALLDGLDFLHRVRNQLHIIEGRRSDVLTFDKQPLVARALGYRSDRTSLAEERLMRDYYSLARETFRIGHRVVGDLTEPARRTGRAEPEETIDRWLRRRGKRVYVATDASSYFEQEPARLIRIFAVALERDCRVADSTRRTIEKLISGGFEPDLSNDRAAREAFLSILRSAGRVGSTLRDMHECRALDLLLPEFRRVACMVRADSYHKYTVDEHLLRATEAADNLRADGGETPEIVRREARLIVRWDLLYLALLIHDIGKGEGRGHVLRSGQMAQRIAARMDLPGEDAETVRRLVLDHLKLSHIALRRDLDDPAVIRRLARDVATLEHLRMLYVLTYCDLSAVSPDSWTEWKSTLLAELYLKTSAMLSGGHPSVAARRTVSADRLIERVRSHLTRPEQDYSVPLAAYIEELPERYIASTPPDQIAHHYEMLDSLDERNRVIWELCRPERANYSELTVVTYDRPGVFSTLCGALASKQINILSAQVFSTKGGGVIDRFQVQDIRGEPLPEGFVLERLRNDVNAILRGEKSLEQLFEKMPRRRPVHRPDVRHIAPPDVVIDNEGSEHCTIIEVKGYDRIGLLYDVTRVFMRHNISIDLALITTEAYRVVDVFYVTDSENKKIDDPAAIERLRSELLEVVSQ